MQQSVNSSCSSFFLLSIIAHEVHIVLFLRLGPWKVKVLLTGTAYSPMPKTQRKTGANRSFLVSPSHFCTHFHCQYLCVVSYVTVIASRNSSDFISFNFFLYSSYFRFILNYILQASFFLEPDNSPVFDDTIPLQNFKSEVKTRSEIGRPGLAKPHAASHFLILVWLSSIFHKSTGPAGMQDAGSICAISSRHSKGNWKFDINPGSTLN